MNEHGYCPHCKADLDGGDIKQTFIDLGESPERAALSASMYGYEPGRTKWGRQIGIYSMLYDRTVAYKCPDCHQTWDRLPKVPREEQG